jgi:ubiquinone/menaquinone biosynthesis C-methylase UbiE
MGNKRIAKGFSFLAPVYDLLARIFFGRAIIHSQTFFFNELPQADHALIFGGGTGKILIELLRCKKAKRYTFVDISPGMIDRARKKFSRYKLEQPADPSTVHFITGSYNDLPGNENYDLIITPYILDCFRDEELPAVITALKKKISSLGTWLFADFNIPARGLMHFLARIITRILYFLFNAVTGIGVKKLPVFEKEFQKQGFKKVKEKFFRGGLLSAKVYVQPAPAGTATTSSLP